MKRPHFIIEGSAGQANLRRKAAGTDKAMHKAWPGHVAAVAAGQGQASLDATADLRKRDALAFRRRQTIPAAKALAKLEQRTPLHFGAHARTPLAFAEAETAKAGTFVEPGASTQGRSAETATTRPTASMAGGGSRRSRGGKAAMGSVAATHHDPLVNSVNQMSLMREVLPPTHAVHLVRMPDGALLVRGVDKEHERTHLQGRGLHPHQDHAHSAYDAMHVHHDGRTGQVIHRMEQEQTA